MTPRRFPMLIVTALIVVGLLMLGGSMIQRSAWTQGYMMGQMAAKGGDNALVPYMAYGPGFGGAPWLGGLACLFTLGLLALAAMAFGAFFRHRAWHGAGGPQAGPQVGPQAGPPDVWRWRHPHAAPPWAQPWNQAPQAETPAAAPTPQGAPPDTAAPTV